MTEKKIVELSRSRGRPLESMDERAKADAVQFGALTGARQEPYLLWLGGFICVVLAVVALAAIAHSYGRLQVGRPPAAAAAVELSQFPSPLADRLSCAEIGDSDLRSPSEGLWVQSNCFPAAEAPFLALSTECNRASLDDTFTPIAPALFVSRGNSASPGYLWYARSETCFDLVSAEVTTAVCADQAVSFKWDARSACAAHGGVLAWVNGR